MPQATRSSPLRRNHIKNHPYGRHFIWCAGRDLNPHAFGQGILSPSCLPNSTTRAYQELYYWSANFYIVCYTVGMKTCSKCGLEKNESEYYVKDSKSNRLHAHCKSCYREHRKTFYAKHYVMYGDSYRERARLRRAAARNEFRNKMLGYLEGKSCVICGENDIRTFELDHLDPSQKLFSISQAVRLGYKWNEVEKELLKCRILCANCHKKHTAEQYGWYKVI